MNEDTRALAEKLVGLASHAKIKLSFAESCTGGLAAAAVTDISGASSVFAGSAVTYSNEAKAAILGVSCGILEEHGAVSAECAEEMAVGSRRIYSSDIAMSVTGIAGPDGGSPEKPVGTVWFGFSDKNETTSFLRVFKGGRREIREASVKQILFFIIERLS